MQHLMSRREAVPPLDRFLALVEQSDDGHWRWRGGMRNFYVGGVEGNTTPRRFAYASFRGPVPPSEVVIAICECRDCVNPAHLITTGAHSGRRPISGAGVCPKGHRVEGGNLYRWISPRGTVQRSCRRCRVETMRRRREEQRKKKGPQT